VSSVPFLHNITLPTTRILLIMQNSSTTSQIQPRSSTTSNELSQQRALNALGYELLGGNEISGWVSCLPPSWVPYIQLTRLTSPAPLLLIYLPHFFGLLYAASLKRSGLLETIQMSAILAGGSVFFSNAAHIWNDLIDADIDTKIDRTRHRPIARGAVSKNAAFVFASSQAILSLLFFILFPLKESAFYAIPNVVATTYYPYAKRHTNFPQFVLGFCLSWGILIGSLAMGVRPFSISFASWTIAVREVSLPLIFLVVACTFWTVIYDTVYAHLDLKQDSKIGVRSTAVFFRDRTKSFLWACLTFTVAFLAAAGFTGRLSVAYFVVSGLGSFVSLSLMIKKVDLKKPETCAWWFSHGFHFAGAAIAAGLLHEYLFAIQAV
jgi:4-hydroxybenzoate polyprenyltransferase